MGKKPYPSCAPIAHVLIIRNSEGEKINGMGTPGSVDHSRMLARSILTSYQGSSTVDIYRFDPSTPPWSQLQPITTVSLDDEQGDS